jgi:hypothetical protein
MVDTLVADSMVGIFLFCIIICKRGKCAFNEWDMIDAYMEGSFTFVVLLCWWMGGWKGGVDR